MSDTSASETTYSDEFNTAVDIIERNAADLSRSDVEDELSRYVYEFGISVTKATDAVANDHGIDLVVPIDDISSPSQSYTIKATFIDDWTDKDNTDTISQAGLFGDESGVIPGSSFTSANLPTFEIGETYLIENTQGNSYQGDLELQFNSGTEITHLPDTSIDVPNSQEQDEYTGTIVKIKPGSGLITRCDHDDCSRTLQNGRCSDHGAQSGTNDLRIKATIDDGSGPNPPTAIFDADMVEALTGMSLDDAISLSADNIDKTVVLEQLRRQVVGKRLTISGVKYDNDRAPTFAVNDFTDESGIDDNAVDEALITARDMLSDTPQ